MPGAQADLLGGDVYITACIPPVARHPRYKQPLFDKPPLFTFLPFGGLKPEFNLKEIKCLQSALKRTNPS
ncbi:MAG: hypothetical protein D8H97_29350, partial [Neisseria sp.]